MPGSEVKMCSRIGMATYSATILYVLGSFNFSIGSFELMIVLI
jgi:hypothetical protein